MNRRLMLRAALALPVAVTACGGRSEDPPAAGSGPVTVTDCAGDEVTVAQVPERVVTLDGYAAQALARLDLTGKVVGTGYPAPFTVDSSPFKEALSEIPVLDERVPATELVAAARPDLVLTAFSAFGGPPGSPKDSDLATMNAVGLAACMPGGGMGMSGGASGPALTDLTPTYDYLRRLGAVFRVEDRAEQIVDELETRQAAVAATVAGTAPRVLLLQDNPVAGQPIKTSGSGTIAHALLTLAGGENIFPDVTAMHADVSPEEVLERDPQVIWVVTDYPFASATGQELVDQVTRNPLLAGTSAARDGRIISMSQYLVSLPSPLNLDGLEQLAADLHPGGA